MSEPTPGFDVPEAPPLLEEPVEPKEPNSYFGIIALSLLLLLLISLSLANYLGSGRESRTDFSKHHTTFRSVILQVEAPKRAGSKSIGYPLDALVTPMKELKEQAQAEPEAAALLATMHFERNEPVPPELLKTLNEYQEKPPKQDKQSAKPKPGDAVPLDDTTKYKLIAEAYAETPPNLERAKVIYDKLQSSKFAFRWAGVHALERAGSKTARVEGLPTSKITFSVVVTSIWALGIGLGIIALIGYLYMRISGNWLPKGHPVGTLTQPEGDRLAMCAARILATFFGTQWIAASLFLPAMDAEAAMALATGMGIVAAIWIASLPFSQSKPSLIRLSFSRQDLGKNILWGVGGALANLPVLLIVALISNLIFSWLPPAEHPISVELQTNQSPLTLLVLFFAATIGAPIIEELTFRGAMLPGLVRLMGRPVLATVVVGLAFAAIHPTGIPAWMPLAMISITASILTNMRGSLIPAIVMHATHNLLLVILTLAIF
ncbi:MAG: CPBP family intramembrane metalloprotease [Fimbriimonadaceae bacterium]|nr:CPBP family intramembrane metalloprotease [Fimbriimonadaceae bacterium]